jgi:hypothetical protein
MALRSALDLYQNRGSVLVTAPASEPVTPNELRAFLSIADDDVATIPEATAASYIEQSRQFIEDTVGLAMITQTWLVAIDRWPTGRELWWDGVKQGAIGDLRGAAQSYDPPRWPLQSISGVNVYNEAGAATSVTVASVFDVDTYRRPGRMTIKSGATLPTATRSTNAIEITYLAGYGAATDVPAPLKRAVIQFAGFLYETRGMCDVSSAYRESGAASLAGPYSVARI